MQTQKGFSLMELMVVIGIIGILSTIGFAVFSNAQSRGRDAKRRLELDAIAKALETNKTDSGYQPLLVGQFQNSTIPLTDPSGYPYCIFYNSTQGNPSAAWTTACPTTPAWTAIANSNTPLANTSSWKLCTSGETIGVVCKTNAQ